MDHDQNITEIRNIRKWIEAAKFLDRQFRGNKTVLLFRASTVLSCSSAHGSSFWLKNVFRVISTDSLGYDV